MQKMPEDCENQIKENVGDTVTRLFLAHLFESCDLVAGAKKILMIDRKLHKSWWDIANPDSYIPHSFIYKSLRKEGFVVDYILQGPLTLRGIGLTHKGMEYINRDYAHAVGSEESRTESH